MVRKQEVTSPMCLLCFSFQLTITYRDKNSIKIMTAFYRGVVCRGKRNWLRSLLVCTESVFSTLDKFHSTLQALWYNWKPQDRLFRESRPLFWSLYLFKKMKYPCHPRGLQDKAELFSGMICPWRTISHLNNMTCYSLRVRQKLSGLFLWVLWELGKHKKWEWST